MADTGRPSMATETELTIRYSKIDDCFHVIAEREVEVSIEPPFPRVPKDEFVSSGDLMSGCTVKDVIWDNRNGRA